MVNERQVHSSGHGWQYGSYGNANYDYGQSGFGESQYERVSHDARPVGCMDKCEYGEEFMSSNIRSSNVCSGLYRHSTDISKQLGFGQSLRYYYYE